LAHDIGITGYVKNIGADVHILAEGDVGRLNRYIKKIKENHPKAAKIIDISILVIPLRKHEKFIIADSSYVENSINNVSADLAICDDCKRELFDSSDRRYQYPLINCTNCGPRYSIVKNVPYDRSNTTMAEFEMCDECREEYNDPCNRRFHAQPVSCNNCGPHVILFDIDGNEIAVKNDAIKQAAEFLKSGEILAVKGIGGYHLVCNALDAFAVKKLRERKKRDEKPFAIMAADIDTIRNICFMSNVEEELISSTATPIVLLKKNREVLPVEIAPNNDNLGVMLPYTPIQLQVFHYSGLNCLVMTSGNIIDEPIVFDDSEVNVRLNGIADYVLSHNRPIHTRVDDSVVRIFDDKPYFLRRSRGYVPISVTVDFIKEPVNIIACGGHLKNSFCLNDGNIFFVSHHIGDLENYETFQAFENGIKLLTYLLGVSPQYILCDMHPDYFSTKYAYDSGLPVVTIQHHRAHIASCMAENNYDGEIIGVAFDGTGYGDDGNIWGGEFFTGTLENLKRAAHLEYVDLPVEHGRNTPWKSAIGYLLKHNFDTKIIEENESDIEMLSTFILNNVNNYTTSSMGRLFDAVSAITGVRNTVTYEGQAAIELEQAANSYKGKVKCYPFDIIEGKIITLGIFGIINGVVKDKMNGCSSSFIAARFHETVAEIILETALELRNYTNINHIALSGGVFQNIYLLNRVNIKLKSANFNILLNRILPANDGGISLGQAVLALYRKGE
jgi:hydrogenase maturation protein HypF